MRLVGSSAVYHMISARVGYGLSCLFDGVDVFSGFCVYVQCVLFGLLLCVFLHFPDYYIVFLLSFF